MAIRGKVLKGAKLTKVNIGDAGLDICSNEEKIIPAKGREFVSTNTFIQVPEGHVGLLWSRSGLSLKHGIEVGAGCVDNTYRGEVKVVLYNHSSEDYRVKKGDRIAQLLTVPVNLEVYEEVDSLEDTNRGSGGFGSTGA